MTTSRPCCCFLVPAFLDGHLPRAVDWRTLKHHLPTSSCQARYAESGITKQDICWVSPGSIWLASWSISAYTFAAHAKTGPPLLHRPAQQANFFRIPGMNIWNIGSLLASGPSLSAQSWGSSLGWNLKSKISKGNLWEYSFSERIN